MSATLEGIIDSYVHGGKEFTVMMIAHDYYGEEGLEKMDLYSLARARDRIRSKLNRLSRDGILSRTRRGRGCNETIFCRSDYGNFEASNLRVRNALKNSSVPLSYGELYAAAFPGETKITGEMAQSVRSYVRQLAIRGCCEMISDAWDYHAKASYRWRWVDGKE